MEHVLRSKGTSKFLKIKKILKNINKYSATKMYTIIRNRKPIENKIDTRYVFFSIDFYRLKARGRQLNKNWNIIN